ncbi:MAG: PAS domain S-box protein [Acidobacteriota bacterium]
MLASRRSPLQNFDPTAAGHRALLTVDREGEARLRALFRGIPVPTYAWLWNGVDFVLVDCNDAALELTGGRASDLLGSTARKVLEPSALEAVESCFAARANLRRELRSYRMLSTGELKHLSVRCVFIPPDLVMVHTEDITDRVLAEEAIRESETRYRLLMEQASDAIWVAGADGIYLDVNHSACQLLGYTREEYLRMHLSRTVMPEELGKTAQTVASVLAGRTVVTERRMRHKDGSTVMAELSARRLDDGRIVAIARDLTERLRMEEELRRSQTLSAMGALIAGVAHEVRNPLFGVSATLDALEAHVEGGQDLAELPQFFQVLRGQLGRLTGLMQDLLDYGRPAAIEPHLLPLGSVVARAVAACDPLARQKGVAVRVAVPDALPPLRLDRDRLSQALINLVENAIQHSLEGGAVTVEAVLLKPSVEITVRDAGPGVAPDDLPHLFEPFFSRRAGGTGLGLSIVQRIVEEHGGRVSAANHPEGGACLTVRLPLPAEE